ncbi:Berberine and berberine like protein [Aspergillus sclerotialis]|uniref:Berberine and berberine like protein n=1 Tax=Aspergillus sclerotialis TaxID=2070753 RepID=A0A3A2ZF02_9EURO|nr:Berberine and berberine like protein [Aspergillus sclerotialis]
MFLPVIAIAALLPLVNASVLKGRALPTSLQNCLKNTGVEALYPGNPEYDERRKPQNRNYDPHPEVIVLPSSSKEVAGTVRCVAAEKGNVKITARGGGHSYAAYSYAGQVIVDSRRMKAMTIDDKRGEVSVQWGQTLKPLVVAIGKRGFALPHGTCPDVGVAGHALGGGWGFLSRKWGWFVDHVVSMEFVDIDGNIKTLSPKSTGLDGELWWALRGAGSNSFGIVTSFTFAMEKAPAAMVNYELAFASESDCAKLLLAVQEHGSLPADDPNGIPLELGAEVDFTGRGTGDTQACVLTGQYVGTKPAFLSLMDRLLVRRGLKWIDSASYIKVFKDWISAETDRMDDPMPAEYYYAKSLLDDGTPGYTTRSAESIFDALRSAREIKGLETDVAFDLNGPGSAPNRPPSTGDMAFNHRGSLFSIQTDSFNFPGFSDPAHEKAIGKLSDLADAIKQADPTAEWHAYQNYVDPRLEDFGHAYYGSNLERLKHLKSVTDPNTVFDFPQGLSRA